MRFLLLMAILHHGDARAYVDPGSGMLLIQGLLAVIAGFFAFVRHPIDALRKLWRRLRHRDDA